jgi:hypothetical protein
MELMVVVVNNNGSRLYALSAIERRPSLSWRVGINFITMICNIRKPILRLQRHRSLGVERFRPRTSRAITFALKASADAVIACE